MTRLPVRSLDPSRQRDYLTFQMHLTQVEIGREAEFKAELDQALAAPDVSGYTLLTAAAVALQKGDLPAATDAMKKAQAVLSPGDFDALVGDYFFRSFAYRAEMSPFLPPASLERTHAKELRMDYFVDP